MNGGKVHFCGNGGSAADAQHLAAELSGRFYYDRAPLNAEALHVNASYITAVANDYSYDMIYSRMLQASAKKNPMYQKSGLTAFIGHRGFYEFQALLKISRSVSFCLSHVFS